MERSCVSMEVWGVVRQAELRVVVLCDGHDDGEAFIDTMGWT